MEKAEFEKRFLALVNQTDVLITAPNVAYHLSLPIEEVQEHLLALELNGTLQQATDAQGNTHYVMPHRPAPGTMPSSAGADPESSEGGGRTLPPGVANPADAAPMPIYSNPGAKGRNINGLVLNIVFPGLGSIICGKVTGYAMLGLLILGLVLFFLPLGWGRLSGFLPIVAAWIWSIFAGISLLDEKETRPGQSAAT